MLTKYKNSSGCIIRRLHGTIVIISLECEVGTDFNAFCGVKPLSKRFFFLYNLHSLLLISIIAFLDACSCIS